MGEGRLGSCESGSEFEKMELEFGKEERKRGEAEGGERGGTIFVGVSFEVSRGSVTPRQYSNSQSNVAMTALVDKSLNAPTIFSNQSYIKAEGKERKRERREAQGEKPKDRS